LKFKKALKKVEATRQSLEAKEAKKTPKRAHSLSKEAKNTESVTIAEVNQTNA